MDKVLRFTKVYDYYLKYWYRFDGANYPIKHAVGVLWSKSGMERLAAAHDAKIELTNNFEVDL